MDMCQTTLKFSLTLTVLDKEKLPMFVHASRTELRATLPKGVLSCVFAVGVLAMNRTSLFVTIVAGLAGSVIVPMRPLLTPFRLIRVAGAIAALPHRLPLTSVAHASPAKMPTEVTGALRLPRNGL